MPVYLLRCNEIRAVGHDLVFELDAAAPIRVAIDGLDSIRHSDGRLELTRATAVIRCTAERIEGVAGLIASQRSTEHRPSVRIGRDHVRATESLIEVGEIQFDLTDVRAFAERGANLPLPNAEPETRYRLVPAALAMLVAEAG